MSFVMEERLALLALSRIKGMANTRKKWIVDNCESVAGAIRGKRKGTPGLSKQVISALPSFEQMGDEVARLAAREVEVVTIKDEGYPPLLREIPDPPICLYKKGPLPLTGRTLSIVGSRKASFEGMLMAEQIAETLSGAGITVVSGLARGMDSAAHKGALRARKKGATIGVLGCGIDVCYPVENHALFEQMAKEAAIVTEYAPGEPPLRHHFPERNRIIAGFSKGVLVVEASQKSGSLITARLALEYGREVMAVPGRVLDEAYKGANGLIKQGARLIEDIGDIVSCCFPDVEFARKSAIDINDDEDYIYRLMGIGRVHVDELIEKSRLETRKVLAILTRLEMKQMIGAIPGGFYIRKA